MANDRFVYVTFIRTTPEKLWEALLKPEFTKQYWFGVTLDSEWKKGSPWKMVFPNGNVTDSGEVRLRESGEEAVAGDREAEAACLEMAQRVSSRAHGRRLFEMHDGDRADRRRSKADRHP